MDQVLAVIVCLVILIPCAVYGISAMRREREQPEPEPQPEPEQEQGEGEETPTFDPDPPTVTVEQTFTQKVTNVALTWAKQSIGGSDESRPAIEPPRPQPAPEPEDWTPPTNLDDLPNLEEWDLEVVRPEPDQQHPPLPIQNSGQATELHRGPFDRVRDMLGDSLPTATPPALSAPDRHARPVLGGFDPDDLDAIPDPTTVPAAELPELPDLSDVLDLDRLPALSNGPAVQVERILTPDHQPDQQPALPSAADPPTMTATTAVEIVTPVELEGVDMADAPLVPIGRRSMAHVPTVAGFQGALRTLGFRALLTWLTSFRKANTNDLGSAQHLHRMAVGHAHRARVKLAIATNMLQAVQADRLGPNVIRGCVNTWLQCNREAAHAFQVVAATDALVRASGGVPVALKDAIRALDRDHGGMAREARKMQVEPVRDMSWYRQ